MILNVKGYLSSCDLHGCSLFFRGSIQSRFHACDAYRASGMHHDPADALSRCELCGSCCSFTHHTSLIHCVVHLLESIEIRIHV